MPGKSAILSKLPRYKALEWTVVDEQTVDDIMSWIRRVHRMSAPHYDLIYSDFVADDPVDTLRRLFDFLKKNTFYFEETEDEQTLRLPAAIITLGNEEGIDCKNYAMFIAGILDAINRSGEQYIPYVYRFASYNESDDIPGHVFIVADVNGVKYWVDPVLNSFDYRLKPSHFIDKKISMLKVISGINNNGSVGFLEGEIVEAAVPFLSNLFGGLFSGSAPNPNDYLHYTDNEARFWVHKDGDSPQNEAYNVIQYMNKKGLDNLDWLLIQMDQSPPVTPALLYEKLSPYYLPQAEYLSALLQRAIDRRAGIPSSASTLATINKYTNSSVVQSASPTGGSSSVDTGSGDLYQKSSFWENNKQYVIGGGVLVLLWLAFKKK